MNLKCAYCKEEAITILDGDAVCEECLELKFRGRQIQLDLLNLR